MRPHSRAFASAIVLTMSTILRRASTPFSCNCANASAAAVHACAASSKTPKFFPEPLRLWQPQSPLPFPLAGRVAGAVTPPPRRPRTSCTTSRIKASLIAVLISAYCFRVIDLLSEDIHAVDDADDHGVDGRILKIRREPGGTALAEQHHLAFAGAHAVHGHDGIHAGT